MRSIAWKRSIIYFFVLIIVCPYIFLSTLISKQKD